MRTMKWVGVACVMAFGARIAYAETPPAPTIAPAPCKYRAENSTAASPAARSTLKLVTTNPIVGGDVRRDTLIEFDVEYRIADFSPNAFFLMPLFKAAGNTANSPGESPDYPLLASAAGKVHLCVPLDEMYGVPTIEWPLQITMSLMKDLGGGSSTVITDLKAVSFNALDAPAESLKSQAGRPPVEYYDNLAKVSNYFENRFAVYKACNQQFPQSQPALTKAYRRWESRHAETAQFIAELQFEQFQLSAGGDTRKATYSFDFVREAMLNGYAKLPAAQLREICAHSQSEFSDPDDSTDSATGDEVSYLRKWRADHPKAATP